MNNPVVTITMENGDVMKAELYPEIAPNTVNNFISLVTVSYTHLKFMALTGSGGMSVTSFLEAMGFFKNRFSTTAMLFLLRLLGSASVRHPMRMARMERDTIRGVTRKLFR